MLLLLESHLFYKVQDAFMATLAGGLPAQHHIALRGLNDGEVGGGPGNNTLWKTTGKREGHALGIMELYCKTYACEVV